MRSYGGHSLTSFTVVEQVSFEKLLHQPGEQYTSDPGLRHFTVSCCGRYLLVTLDKDIFIYRLSSLEPVARLVASSSIIAVSMDTSSGRYSVAALAQGRLGLTWDLHHPDVVASVPIGGSTLVQDDTLESLHGVVHVHTESPENTSPQLTGVVEGLEINTHPTVYRNLGTDSDYPRSVAICPQRKCVAFGCRSGVELHWRTPDSDANLNRWFPLGAPSDHLFFLPQRPHVDSARKLRLISSAAGPSKANRTRQNSAPTRWTFRSTTPRRGRMHSMTRLFFGSLPFPSALTRRGSATPHEEGEHRGVLRTVDCDHYRAVPMSDGAHMLFTDPATGLLCLGSDAPLGGPTKLMRKVCMIPPESEEPEGASTLICYQVGHDLRWGVRVVAAYDDGRIILYNIPADCFQRIKHIRSSPDVWDELAGVLGQSDLLMDVYMASQEDLSADEDPKTFQSIQVEGLEIYKAESEVEDIQVECAGGGVKIWLFLTSSKAIRLGIYVPRHFRPVDRYVGADGLVHPGTSRRVQETKGKMRASSSEDVEAASRHVKFVVFE